MRLIRIRTHKLNEKLVRRERVAPTDESASPADFYAGPRHCPLVSKQRFPIRGALVQRMLRRPREQTLDHEIKHGGLAKEHFSIRRG
jgi:hypothetical protein